jgi:hypothetical protein
MRVAEFDMGVLSRAERDLIPPKGEAEQVERQLGDALARAASARRNLNRIERGTPEFGAENYRRHQAREQAEKNASRLLRLTCTIPQDLQEQLDAEGITV